MASNPKSFGAVIGEPEGGVNLYDTYSNFPDASTFGVGIAQAEDTGAVYASDGTDWLCFSGLVLSVSNSAAENTALIQSALDNRGVVRLTTPLVGQVAQDILINDTLLIPSNTTLVADPGLNLKLAPGVSKTMIVNYAYTQAYTTISGGAGGITVSGLTATIEHNAHGFSVGEYVETAGVTQRYYNGVYRVVSVPDANHFTVRLRRAPPVTTSTGTPKIKRADSNIALVNVSLDYDKPNQVYSTTLNMMCTIFSGIYNFYCDKFKAQNCIKYGLGLGAIAHGKVYDSWFWNTFGGADGVHQEGPCHDLVIDGVTGSTGDDTVAFTVGDNPIWEYSRGDFIDCVVRNIYPDYSNASAFKYAGNAPYTADIIVENIGGVYANYGAVVYDDTNSGGILVGTNAERIIIKNVHGRSLTNANQISVRVGGTIEEIELDAYQHNPAGACIDISSSSYAVSTIKKLKVHAANDHSIPASGSTYMVSFGKFNADFAEVHVSGKVKSGFGIYIPDATTDLNVKTLEYHGDLEGEGTSIHCSHIYQGAPGLSNISMHCKSKNMREHFSQNSNIADNPVYLNLVNIQGDGGARVADLYTSGTVNVGNVVLTNHAAVIPLRCAKGKQVHFRGNRPVTNNNVDDITTSGSGTIYVLPHGPFKIDGANVSAGGGLGAAEDNHFFNSNSAWAGGTGTDKRGKYAWNGSLWSKVYGPA